MVMYGKTGLQTFFLAVKNPKRAAITTLRDKGIHG